MTLSFQSHLPPALALAVVLGLTGFAPRDANATLLGTDVDISLVELQGATLTTYFAETVSVVDPGVEIPSLFDSFAIDLAATTIRLDILSSGPIQAADFLGFLFESIAADITGIVEADSNIVGFDLPRLIVETNAVAFDLQGLEVEQGNFIELALEFADVPEPATAVLMTAAVAGVFGARRGKR